MSHFQLRLVNQIRLHRLLSRLTEHVESQPSCRKACRKTTSHDTNLRRARFLALRLVVGIVVIFVLHPVTVTFLGVTGFA
jgi:hypothetical protein